ncbi:MAG: NAD-dependent epimerase/dehydratase family protein [Bacteroidetes bacterium]|nr:NAD-dependent epimerase/dehydratase family protein [Bacteroidota bacterium]
MILVTGATGLLGSHLLAKLALQQKKVRALYRDAAKKEAVKQVFSFYTQDVESLFASIDWAEADVTDYFSLKESFEGISEVYHCAGMVSLVEKDKKQLYAINAEGTAHVVNLALEQQVEKFCHVSSIVTLQVQAHKKYIDELSVWKTSSENSSYAISKYRGEFEAWRGAAEGLNVVVVNPSTIIGPGCWGQSSSEIITRCYRGVPVYTEGINGYIDVRDVVNCMIQLMNEKKFNHRYILNAENCSFKEITHTLQESFNKRKSNIKVGKTILTLAWICDSFWSFITQKKPTLTHEMAYLLYSQSHYDNTKVCKDLGYSFIPIKKSLHDAAQKYKEHLRHV